MVAPVTDANAPWMECSKHANNFKYAGDGNCDDGNNNAGCLFDKGQFFHLIDKSSWEGGRKKDLCP